MLQSGVPAASKNFPYSNMLICITGDVSIFFFILRLPSGVPIIFVFVSKYLKFIKNFGKRDELAMSFTEE